MTDDLAKRKIKEYYDKQAQSYSSSYGMGELDPNHYPSNSICIEICTNILQDRGIKSLLDIGCGSGASLIHFLKAGFDARGIDFSEKTVEAVRSILVENSYEAERVALGDIESRETLPNRKFDAVNATGVFQHCLNDGAALANLRDLMNDGGIALVQFRNALMSLFSENEYSAAFFWDELIEGDNLPDPLKGEVRAFLAKEFDSSVEDNWRDKAFRYGDIFARPHNPLTLGSYLSSHGLTLQKIHYFHYHVAPPRFERQHKDQFWERSMTRERQDDWRAMFMCSAFVAEITK